MTIVSDRRAETDAPIHDLLAERWSPRSYDPSGEIDETELVSLLEAARWAPSWMNTQPRRFIVARRGTAEFDAIVERLAPFNATWASTAPVLVVTVAELRDADGEPVAAPEYDLGQAVAHLTVQAHALGLHVRQMGGIDGPALAERFGVPDRFRVTTAVAVGRYASPEVEVDPSLRDRDAAPRARKPLSELVNPSDWS